MGNGNIGGDDATGMRCPRCGKENPPETLFCEGCDWRLDMPFRAQRVRSRTEVAGATLFLGILAIVCCLFSGIAAAVLGAVAMVAGGYSLSLLKLTGSDSKGMMAMAGAGLMLGVIGFLVGFSTLVGALRWPFTGGSTSSRDWDRSAPRWSTTST